MSETPKEEIQQEEEEQSVKETNDGLDANDVSDSPFLDAPIVDNKIEVPVDSIPNAQKGAKTNQDPPVNHSDHEGLGADDVNMDSGYEEAYEEPEMVEDDEDYHKQGESYEEPEFIEYESPFKHLLSDLIAKYGFEKGLPSLFYSYAKINDKKALELALKYADYDFSQFSKEVEKQGGLAQELFNEISKRNAKIRKAFEPDAATNNEVKDALRQCLDKWEINKDVGPEGRLVMALTMYSMQSFSTAQQLKKESEIFEKQQNAKLDRFEELIQRMENAKNEAT
jgi:hypothetical protein